LYLGSAAILNAVFLGAVLKLRATAEWQGIAWWLYRFSLLYLALLFLAMAIDRVIARP